MSSVRIPPKDPCWILWELFEGKMYLRSINTVDTLAGIHKRCLIHEAEELGRLRPKLYIEKSQMNHLYGRNER